MFIVYIGTHVHKNHCQSKQLGDWDALKSRGVPDSTIARVTGISRATYYRRKNNIAKYGLKGLEKRSTKPKNGRKSKIPKSTIALILRLRTENPTYGKSKISVILMRDHNVILSESSVGRILRELINSGKIQRYHSARGSKRKRKFNKHAQRWRYGMRAKQPGELIQIDHMTVTRNGITAKHFQAWDPITKYMVIDIYYNAKSRTARKFLRKVIKEMVPGVKSIQVDGGSEFMKDFESECQDLKIPLFVLPPSRPQYNGGVERGNRTIRDEFYCRKDVLADSIGAMRI